VALSGRVDAVELDADVGEGLELARAACERLGAQIVELEPAEGPAMADLSTILFAESAAHHARYAGRASLYRTSIREFVELAAGFDSAKEYIEAQAARAQATAAWEAWFAAHRIDALLEPTVPLTAQLRGSGYDSGNLGGQADPLIAFTATWNMTGFPVAALPAALGARSGLPVGVSLIAPRGREAQLLALAIDLQEHELRPLAVPAAPC
jgi:Asp-tRNA(Asn)/Glu-tRNA(Gln) amidotransferase A subunit family amidase